MPQFVTAIKFQYKNILLLHLSNYPDTFPQILSCPYSNYKRKTEWFRFPVLSDSIITHHRVFISRGIELASLVKTRKEELWQLYGVWNRDNWEICLSNNCIIMLSPLIFQSVMGHSHFVLTLESFRQTSFKINILTRCCFLENCEIWQH